MKTILFQGDSITDAARNRGDDNYMGMGYATLAVDTFACSATAFMLAVE